MDNNNKSKDKAIAKVKLILKRDIKRKKKKK